MTRPFYTGVICDSVTEKFPNDLFLEITFDIVIICTFFLISDEPKFKSETIERSVFSFLNKSGTNNSFFNFWKITSDDIKNDFFPDFLYNVIVTKLS